MPKRKDIKTILVIGSGPIIIGQAAEFDYAGTQACLSLREEGYEVILVNSNPATIMTDKEIADKVYIEPLTVEFLSKIIRKEKPDALLPTLGGQVALNLAVALHESGVLDECGVEILGTKLTSIKQAEDRELFRDLMNELNEPVPDSAIVHTLEEAEKFVKEIGYPVIVRPAFTMGGTGGGICYNDEDLEEIVPNGLNYSPVHQCLLEKSIAGYKEIEYEVMRDNNDTAIVVLVDLGMKIGIVRELVSRGCDVIVVPYNTTAEEVLRLEPDGVMLTNGPGDPEDAKESIEMIKGIIDKVTIFGICMGHQLVSLACGAKTYKLKFGHRGGNHPVKNILTGRVDITSQNHGYAVDIDSLKDTDLELTHIAINDRSCEGVRHKKYPVFTVQFHPEAAAGPHDTSYLFDEFIKNIDKNMK